MGDERAKKSFAETVTRIAIRLRVVLLAMGGLGAVGLILAMKFDLGIIATFFSGIFAGSLTLYVFVRLWPNPKEEEEETVRRVEEVRALVAKVESETRPGPLRVRKGHVKLSQRATKALAMTIKGMIARDRERR